MLDIKILRTEPDKIREALKNRNSDLDITPAIELDVKRRELLTEVEQMKAKQNEITKKLPAMKKAGEDTAPVFAEMKIIGAAFFNLDSFCTEGGEITCKYGRRNFYHSKTSFRIVDKSIWNFAPKPGKEQYPLCLSRFAQMCEAVCMTAIRRLKSGRFSNDVWHNNEKADERISPLARAIEGDDYFAVI